MFGSRCWSLDSSSIRARESTTADVGSVVVTTVDGETDAALPVVTDEDCVVISSVARTEATRHSISKVKDANVSMATEMKTTKLQAIDVKQGNVMASVCDIIKQ